MGEVYEASKYFELRVPTLPLTVTSTTPTICFSDGKELKLIATGNCTFKVSTAKTKDYSFKGNYPGCKQLHAARSKPELVMSVITNQTAKSLPKTIEIFRVYSPTGVYVLPQATTPAVCIAQWILCSNSRRWNLHTSLIKARLTLHTLPQIFIRFHLRLQEIHKL